MPFSKLTSKNQITIPKEVCNYLQLHVGDKLEFIFTNEKTVLLRPKNLSIDDLTGILKPPKTSNHVSIEDMRLAAYKYFTSSIKSKDC